MPKYQERLDGIFASLADPTRREVIRQLADGPASTSQLAEPFDMSLPAFTQHLQTLEAAGLVRSRKQGRVRTYQLDDDGLAIATSWLDAQRALWEQRLDRLDALLLSMKDTP